MASPEPTRDLDPASEATRGPRLGGLAFVIMIGQIVGTTVAAWGDSARLDLVGYLLLAIGALALLGRHPVARPIVVAGATVAYDVLDYPRGPTFLALVVALAAAAKTGHRGAAWAVAIGSYAAWVGLDGATLAQALTLAAWAIGVALVIAFVLHAAPMIAEMAREQRRLHEERQRRQASEERLRIATELHDVLGHHLSLINVRASVGRHLMDQQPDQARTALDTIKEASAEALREVQSVLNTLYPTGEAAPRAPAPGLDRLDELTVDAGLPVAVSILGGRHALPAEIDRAAYRIVQEALTNVRRHAGAATTAAIMIHFRPDELVVQVDDDGGLAGPAAVPMDEGNGITGMRERAAALGGSLTARPLPEGGWRVRAVLPLPETEPKLSPEPEGER